MKHLFTSLFLSLFLFVVGCSKPQLTEQEAFDFLYTYMPLPDRVDYDSAFFLRNVEASFQARREMPWGQDVPDREFLHFVLPVRVNNENLDESRQLFYKELKERVCHLSMQDAILEVNHWCHEKVTYTPSDERTSSPLASVRTAYGRCGEESTFTVAALRAVGIPARQVYTPRWAHTDDNHAWVEAWADGQWYFLGACEPEAVLNLGWFNAPASRGMFMHTKVFGHYDGPEEIVSQNECYTEINVTRNYAPVGKASVKVVSTSGAAIEGASVEFKLYNYAEFYTVSRKVTDAQGLAHIEAGQGDLLAWAYKDNRYGFAQCSVLKGDTVLLVLDKESGKNYSADFTIVPPVGRNTVPQLTEEQQQTNTARLHYEDSLRNAYIATFDTSTELLRKSRGNHADIKAFLNYAADTARAQQLLHAVSDKDLRDIACSTLCDFYDYTPADSLLPPAFYAKYVLSPRVANEMVLPHRAFFQQVLTTEQKHEWKADVHNLIAWINANITITEDYNPQHLRMLPTGVWRSRRTDAFSRNIFFVSLCRTLGVPVRIDPVTAKVQFADNTCSWTDVHFASDANHQPAQAAVGTLRATYSPSTYLANPKYYSHFTLSSLREGCPVLLNYAEEDTYESLLQSGTQLDAGDYLLVTGTRLADGSVLAHIELFPVPANSTTVVPLLMRTDTEALQVIGSFNSEHLYRDSSAGLKSILSTTGRGYFVVGLLASNHEPSNHVLRDMALYKNELEEWGRPILLLFSTQKEYDAFRPSDFPALPNNVHFGVDETGQIAAELQGQLPIVKIADTFNRVVFSSEGYTIGLGETLLKAIRKL